MQMAVIEPLVQIFFQEVTEAGRQVCRDGVYTNCI